MIVPNDEDDDEDDQCVRTASCYVGDRGSASDLRCRPATAVSEKTSNSQVFFSFVQCL